jgi:DNA replication and repair protein RecF
MAIETLTIRNFRNFGKLRLSLSPRLNLLIGPNAQGKTNILEAIHLLSTTKSFRTGRDRDLIKFGATTAYLATNGVEIGLQPGLKSLKLHGKEARAAEVLGEIRSVLFAPQDMDLLTGLPQGRRSFLDELISRVDRKYLMTIISYHRTLRQRNRLLYQIRDRQARIFDLTSWNNLLVRDGSEILLRRGEVIRALQQELERLGPELLGEVGLELKYLSKIQPRGLTKEALERAFSEGLASQQEMEIRAATTAVGPHRDDWEVLGGGQNMGRFGSRGEQRASILALKLAEVNFNEREAGSRPILLLDDVLSELDREHQDRLLSEVGKQQTVVSSTSTELFPQQLLAEAKIFQVMGAQVKENGF